MGLFVRLYLSTENKSSNATESVVLMMMTFEFEWFVYCSFLKALCIENKLKIFTSYLPTVAKGLLNYA